MRVAELEAVLDCQRDVVILYDPEMNVRRANAAFVATYGFAPEGLNVREIIARVRCRLPDGSPLVLSEQPTPLALRGHAVEGRNFLVTRADGTSAVVESTATPMRSCGKIVGSVTVWHDVTQQQRTEDDLKGSEKALRERARKVRPEVILCDIGLPGMDGYQVAKAIRADESLRHIHLVALSGYALPDDLRRSAQAGFEHHLAKPPSIEKLERILANLPPTGPDHAL